MRYVIRKCFLNKFKIVILTLYSVEIHTLNCRHFHKFLFLFQFKIFDKKENIIITDRIRSMGKVMFLHLCFILFTWGMV